MFEKIIFCTRLCEKFPIKAATDKGACPHKTVSVGSSDPFQSVGKGTGRRTGLPKGKTSPRALIWLWWPGKHTLRAQPIFGSLSLSAKPRPAGSKGQSPAQNLGCCVRHPGWGLGRSTAVLGLGVQGSLQRGPWGMFACCKTTFLDACTKAFISWCSGKFVFLIHTRSTCRFSSAWHKPHKP